MADRGSGLCIKHERATGLCLESELFTLVSRTRWNYGVVVFHRRIEETCAPYTKTSSRSRFCFRHASFSIRRNLTKYLYASSLSTCRWHDLRVFYGNANGSVGCEIFDFGKRKNFSLACKIKGTLDFRRKVAGIRNVLHYRALYVSLFRSYNGLSVDNFFGESWAVLCSCMLVVLR